MQKLQLLFVTLVVAFAGAQSSAGYSCYAEPWPSHFEERIFGQDACSSVYNNPLNPTSFTISETRTITKIGTYHWNEANGVTPGTIELKDQSGNIWGPWQAIGLNGMGGVPNAYWVVYLQPLELPAGTYTIMDSDPSTWSHNSESGNSGIVSIIALATSNESAPMPGTEHTSNQGQKEKADDSSGQRLSLAGLEWTAIDDPSPSEPSKWIVQNNTLQQLTNIFREDREYEFWQGTHIVAGSLDWTDYILSFDMTPTDDDGVGAIVRYQDKENYYRFIMVNDSSNEGPFQRLEKFADGQRIVLASNPQGYVSGQTYSIQFKALGSSLEIWMNDEKILAAKDDTFRSGKVGFMDYASTSLTISNIKVLHLGETDQNDVT